jgi:polysaccharide export outer membrane protein
VFVVGEVRTPGRYTLEGPTTAIQSIALAGGWSNGGNVRHIVVFRRAEDWRLLATRLDLQGALYGKRPAPADEIWLRDSDIVVVPKSTIKQADDLIELVFTNGIYRVFPISFNYTWGNGSTITNPSP